MLLDTQHVDPPVALSPGESVHSLPTQSHGDLRDDEFWRVIPGYRDVGAQEFRSHLFQQKQTVTNARQLRETLGTLVPEAFYEDLGAGLHHAPMALRISPYLLGLIDWENALGDPIRTQFLPLRSQQQPDHPMLRFDSLHEQDDSPVPGLTHRYRTRRSFSRRTRCPVYCRFCTRSYAVGAGHGWSWKSSSWRRISRAGSRPSPTSPRRPELEDIVISGGDSYNFKAEHLASSSASGCCAMPNIRRIRYATKGLCVMPQKILSDHAWVDALTRVVELGRRCTRTWWCTRTSIIPTKSPASPTMRWIA